ncbi:uncharacterized protein SEPMUDRAFT_121396 [Sphaerulina musiva SO2202]|uniref:Uncharacterized protein n=1 Tax=Sphaerulina musiva (strain SO2202) TaxID=692275 RepID=M3CY59_SPHMS|nr:uncharacterized protein SEPMUDRAFT_121396 [Sphaerulina musiva SO2202]EMF08621.1 hypothetical protein SEPMUDRAFT_121396 [Sphaerulina musiva SO2202]
MSAQADVEMQYQAPTQMDPAATSDTSSTAQKTCAKEQPKRTFLGMRGGGIIFDLCACFICCECRGENVEFKHSLSTSADS